MLYILTDGKNYVMKDDLGKRPYIPTTSPNHAKEFTFKEAQSLLRHHSKGMAWIRNYYMVKSTTNEKSSIPPTYKGNGGSYIGENDIDFDVSIIEKIFHETNSIMNLYGWSPTQLKTYEEQLNRALSKYDSAESDIDHALQKYKEDNDGKKPQAHKMAKVGYLLDEVRDIRKKVKQSIHYVQVMENAATSAYSLEKLKLELEKAKHVEYKGRTEYYQKALDLLN